MSAVAPPPSASGSTRLQLGPTAGQDQPAPADSRPPSARGGFRPDIEGLRALAVLSVMAYHAGLPGITGGFTGVDVFFVLSGFLITSHLLKEIATTGTVSLPTFYARRARRLLPAATLVLLVTALGSWLLLPVTRFKEIAGDIAASAVYLVNWRLAGRTTDYLAEDSVASPVQHYWSLAVEEQFYVVWPLLLLVVALVVRRTRLPLLPVATVGLLLIAVPSLVWSVVHTADAPEPAYFVTTTRLWELAIGGLVACAGRLWERLSPRSATALVVLGLAGLAASFVLVGPSTPWPGIAAAAPTLATAAALVGGVRARGPVSTLLGSAPMVWVGGLSYSLYLWHWPLVVFTDQGIFDERAPLWATCAAVLAAFPLAWAGHHLVENPLRFSPRLRPTGRSLGMAAALAVIGLGSAGMLWRAVPHVPTAQVTGPGAESPGSPSPGGESAGTAGGPSDSPAEEDEASPAGGTDSAAGPGEESSSAPPEPRYGAAALLPADLPLDEITADVQPVLTEEALPRAPQTLTPSPTEATTDLPLTKEPGCIMPVNGEKLRECEFGDPDGKRTMVVTGDSKIDQWMPLIDRWAAANDHRVVTYLKSACPWNDVLQAEDDERWAECHSWGQKVSRRIERLQPDVLVTSSLMPGTGSDGTEKMIRGYRNNWEPLVEAGTKVVVVDDTPGPTGDPVYECVAEQLDSVDECDWEADRARGTDVLKASVEAVPGTRFLTLNDFICPEDRCRAVIGDVLTYRQGSHLTNTFVETVEPIFTARLEAALEEAP
ncbi:Peptidoglycan/LPS O-acetylase OafA/YrhL, contains acyltransferase and SGNH-hydrolase domains [Kytococcus aerolatus]|uniref:Peptidoglycan/LPS O-acetylase OafA/YrhL, contains acyltransferase and SGNH-hydrolase domains n=1 Tax=Kytococcus aerolatus TaxID=592308 RepID=A0A212TH76_9MICO|nr:acyltransferase family protein [Kytococcus aerolatus]SNC65389.1 Peptidoglycan/LPS O-acetylase OafA/YrhL, contains acyltransferase and SGNH-hydrolase domains [Kytococcus aerolatus]